MVAPKVMKTQAKTKAKATAASLDPKKANASTASVSEMREAKGIFKESDSVKVLTKGGKAYLKALYESEPKGCTTCKQSSHDYERALRPKMVRVHWIRIDISRQTGKPYFYGHECYGCSACRKRFFEENQDEIDRRMENPEFKSRFMELRNDKVTGRNEFAHLARQPLKVWVQQLNTKFTEAFETGTFYDLKLRVRV